MKYRNPYNDTWRTQMLYKCGCNSCKKTAQHEKAAAMINNLKSKRK